MEENLKQLLLKDLSARLPYYPICEMTDRLRVINNEPNPSYAKELFPKDIELFSYHNNFEIKPYLRPMSEIANLISAKEFTLLRGIELMDWYNANHIDYRGLIEKGLAIEITEENNPYKK